MSYNAGELLAAISLVVDLSPNSTRFHCWSVALVAKKIAEAAAPEIADEVFYAALLHEIGCVGPEDGHAENIFLQSGSHAFTYPAKGSAIIAQLPGMLAASQYVYCHHEWIDGTGYPEGLQGDIIPLGGQILALAEAVVMSGFLDSGQQMMERLKPLALRAGHAWTPSLLSHFLKSVSDAEYYKAIIDKSTITKLMQSTIDQSRCPVPSDNIGIESVLESAARIVDNKNPVLAGHSTRVALESLKLAEYMNVDEPMKTDVYYAGLIHDLGKVIIPSHILNTPGRLSEEQKRVVKGHAEIVMRLWCGSLDSENLRNLSAQAFHDHERFDGGGYPDGLKGENIPMASRIISVVDTYDVITTSDYTFRMVSPKGAISRVRQEAGNQFDPEVVEAFLEMKNNASNESVA